MTTASEIVEGALMVRGEFSSILNADSSFLVVGFKRLLQRLATLESEGVIIPFTIPDTITDDLLEPDGVAGPLTDILSVYLTGIQTAITPDQKQVAKESLRFLEGKYLNSNVIPEQRFPTTTPRGAGNTRFPYTNEFYPDPDAVLDTNTGVLNVPLGDC